MTKISSSLLLLSLVSSQTIAAYIPAATELASRNIDTLNERGFEDELFGRKFDDELYKRGIGKGLLGIGTDIAKTVLKDGSGGSSSPLGAVGNVVKGLFGFKKRSSEHEMEARELTEEDILPEKRFIDRLSHVKYADGGLKQQQNRKSDLEERALEDELFDREFNDELYERGIGKDLLGIGTNIAKTVLKDGSSGSSSPLGAVGNVVQGLFGLKKRTSEAEIEARELQEEDIYGRAWEIDELD